MRSICKSIYGLSAGALAALLTGCSLDVLVWGSEGAEVIQIIETLMSDLASGETSDIVCMDSAADLGTSKDWSGLSAGEPQEFALKYWDGQVALNPQWSINLGGSPSA